MAGRGHRRTLVTGMMLLLLGCLPAILGQGCPSSGSSDVIPIFPGQTIPGTTDGSSSTNGNVAPRLTFIEPSQDVDGDIGDVITIRWSDQDPDDNAAITLLLDPNRTFGDGDEIVILPLVQEDNDVTGDVFNLDTTNLLPGSYNLIARISDGTNPQVLVTAAGRILLFGEGLRPGNISPTIRVLEPVVNLGVTQGDAFKVELCSRDRDDDGQDPATTPDIVVLMDLDTNPLNDLDLTGPDAEQLLQEICVAGFFPVELDGAYVIGCFKDNDCGEPVPTPQLDAQGNPVVDANGDPILVDVPAPSQEFDFTVDVGLIPRREGGEPYYIRATIWDRRNAPVHAYAPGTVNVTLLGSGTIDLANVGRSISGSVFLGFNAGDRTGFAGTDVGDIDDDGIDDFVIISRFGRGFEIGNVGSAHVVLGLEDGQKFASEVPLNSISTTYRGSLLYMPFSPQTEGITTACRMGDVTGDGKPDVLFGAPYIQQFPDDHDDDPCDCPASEDVIPCYLDLLPNPLCTEPEADTIGTNDRREFGQCSNDLDTSRATPIDGGYAFLLASDNNLASSVRGFRGFGNGTTGALFRGAWWDVFDDSQTVYPSRIIPDNRFGQTVRTMPPMTETSLLVNPRFGTTLLISAPEGNRGRGRVLIIPNNTFTEFTEGNTQSLPAYVPGPCPGRALLYPGFTTIVGAAIGDQLGYAAAAGDYNLDGSRDILCGAPGADRLASGAFLNDVGIVYILYGRPDFPSIDLGELNPPRMEIHGLSTGDRFGEMQTIVGDINNDGLADIGFSSGFADGPGGVDSGFVGIVFGGRRITGEEIFSVNQIATAQLPGVKIYGTQPSGYAGTQISNVGDFNGDSFDDLLVLAPNELRTVAGIPRVGVAYLIFGGPHLINGSFNLSQVGTDALPGAIIVSPYQVGAAEEAPIDSVSAAGDVNGDGFADILIGVSEADYVNPLEPSQRRIDSGEMYLIYGSNTGTNILP